MMKSYERLGLEELRGDAERILRRNFPDSALFATGLQFADRSWWQVWR
jgi:outer membrane protein assembly factor BamD